MKLQAAAAAFEAATGLFLIFCPSLLVSLLLGTELSAPGQAVARVGGFGLLSLGIACWPQQESSGRAALRGLLAYNVLVTIFLAYLGVRSQPVGPLLWPAVAIHAIIIIFLVRAWMRVTARP